MLKEKGKNPWGKWLMKSSHHWCFHKHITQGYQSRAGAVGLCARMFICHSPLCVWVLSKL